MSTKRITSQDVADYAGVSRTTVSLVLNNVETAKISPATREKVFQAADSLGYVPDAAAQALASRRARNIGLIFTRRLNYISSDAFIPLILDGLIDVIHQNDMRLLLDIVEPARQAEVYIEFVRGKRIDGILLSGPWFDQDALRVLRNEGFPTVIIGQLPGSMFYSVDIDNYAAAKEAVAYLVKLGHEKIACITNASLSHPAALDRLSGYRTALEETGLEYNEELISLGYPASRKSKHLEGCAADISVHGKISAKKLKKIARELWHSCGVGLYNWGIHIDTGPRRDWDYRK